MCQWQSVGYTPNETHEQGLHSKCSSHHMAHPSAQPWAAAASAVSHVRFPVAWWRTRFSLCARTSMVWISLGAGGGGEAVEPPTASGGGDSVT
jgi:hypothetical protein